MHLCMYVSLYTILHLYTFEEDDEDSNVLQLRMMSVVCGESGLCDGAVCYDDGDDDGGDDVVAPGDDEENDDDDDVDTSS